MDAEQLQGLKPEFDLFLDRYAPRFGHVGNGGQARRFVQGLLLGGDRRSAENIAEAIDGGVVRSLQKFLGQGRWDGDAVLQELQSHVAERFGDPDAVLNVDETGFPKKGTKSVGVKRQYAGCLGRTDNCQVGVFVNYFTAAGHTLVDRRLFLPEEWASDGPRRRAAGVPEGVVFRTKPELALEMVQAAVARDMPFRWVTADSVYGESPTFVQGVRGLGKWYVVDVGCDARVWLEEPKVIAAGTKGGRGRPTAKPKVATKPVRVDEVAAQLPASAWRRVVVAEGSQGPRIYDYAVVGVWFSEEGLPSGRERLLLRRSIGQHPEVKYHRTNAPEEVPLDKAAQVRGCHWTVEQSFEAAKGECGLDEYETRGWVGWHHHITLSLLALWFLVLQRQRPGEKKRGTAERPRGARRTRAFAGAA
jgi:SRSO17 transposase